ncbi:MAG: 16S rRNA (guanine(966)-N(2))-methyltransferase RsmD [Gammaproteobacteria bacterium]|nr:16S rRNA (guanine(966)-N(2))-methyltransferase RsmD [Gammaproteobacteria bacterium]MDH3449631.1 16S rRNA (guanine(966)-N(2))-methyltransferase RsmD [Gammaproteobacteria bacterium]
MKSQVRIIGGKWRGSKIPVVDIDGLRPTPDRIRETLFNWLAPHCRGATVLDCFAGTGVLGFEALSRGAGRLVALERDPAALASLRRQAVRFDPDAIEIIAGDTLESIARLQHRFDQVFVDPPYAIPGLRHQVIERLEASACLQPGARIYFEWPNAEDFELPSPRLEWLQLKSAGQVNYAIAEWQLSG